MSYRLVLANPIFVPPGISVSQAFTQLNRVSPPIPPTKVCQCSAKASQITCSSTITLLTTAIMKLLLQVAFPKGLILRSGQLLTLVMKYLLPVSYTHLRAHET